MRLALLVAGLAVASAACGQRAPVAPPAEQASPPAPAPRTEIVPSPDGSASFVYTDTGTQARVRLAVGADTTDVLDADGGKSLGVEWLAPDLGRVWVPFGNYTYAAVYTEPSSRRVSPWLEFAVAVDPEAETVATLDPEAVTLRALWSGEPLAAWVPEGLSIYDLRHECEPSFSLSGRSATMRYDCGEGEREQDAVW